MIYPRQPAQPERLARLPCLLFLVIYTILLVTYHALWPQVAKDGQIPYRSLPSRASCDFLTLDQECPKIMEFERSAKTGLGHQISEIIFGMHLSTALGATLKVAPFDVTLPEHSKSGYKEYSSLETLLGLHAVTFHDSFNTTVLRAMINVAEKMPSNIECHVLYKSSWQRCFGGCGAECSLDCFFSPALALAFHQQAPCVRSITKRHGAWQHRNPYLSVSEFIVAWHVRVGDFEPRPPEDLFYENIYKSLKDLLEDFINVRVIFIADWGVISDARQSDYRSALNGTLPFRVEFPSLNVEESLMYMMHADLLIGSGSSFPLVAALFSEGVLYVNVRPKHGWNYLAEFLPEGLMTEPESGSVINHLFEIREKIKSKAVTKSRFAEKIKQTALKFYYS